MTEKDKIINFLINDLDGIPKNHKTKYIRAKCQYIISKDKSLLLYLMSLIEDFNAMEIYEASQAIKELSIENGEYVKENLKVRFQNLMKEYFI